ncbi:MAG TPA: hypothetical protein VGF95_03895 [Solirubrobacteraceae bacterium]
MALGVATSAAVAAPIGEYAAFKECPLSVPNIESCIYSETTSGEVVIGSTATPISAPIVFQGGETRENIIKEIEVKGKIRKESEEVRKFVPAANGETLVKTPEPVPGGLAGLIKCNEITNLIGKALCQLVFENGLTGVNATTELVGEANFSFDALASGETGLIMPVRLHLENPLLGSECYVGSAGDPIMFELTTGITSPPAPNEPITGSSGAVEVRNGGSLVIAHEDSAVDNSFAVPDASGCGGSLLSVIIDPIIDAKLGLPSEAGNNAAILNGTLEAGSVEAVEASE